MLLDFADFGIQIGFQAGGHHDDTVDESLIVTGGLVFLSQLLRVVPPLTHEIRVHTLFEEPATELLVSEDLRKLSVSLDETLVVHIHKCAQL
jgi:hypothetical protein